MLGTERLSERSYLLVHLGLQVLKFVKVVIGSLLVKITGVSLKLQLLLPKLFGFLLLRKQAFLYLVNMELVNFLQFLTSIVLLA